MSNGAMNAALKGMKLLESRIPHKKKTVEQLKRWTIVKGDKVQVTDGPEEGKQGIVLKVLRDQARVIIEGVNVRRRTQKPTQGGQPGKIITYPGAIAVSNVSLLDPNTNEPTKVSRRYLEDGTRVRVARWSGEIITKPEFKRDTLRRAAAGPKDTAPADVYEVTWEDYVAPVKKAKAGGGGGE